MMMRKWRSILRDLNRDFYHQVVKGTQIEVYLSAKTGMDLKPLFNQYLRDVRIPELDYYFRGKQLYFKWNNCVKGFNIPVKVDISGHRMILNPTSEYRSVETGNWKKQLTVDPNWYVTSKKEN